MTLVVVLVVATQVGRAAANLAAGCAPGFPPTAAGWVTSTPAVLAGDAAAGLSLACSRAATLAWCITLAAAVLFAVTAVAVWVGWRRWGPGGVQGVASPREVRDALGVRRLYRNRRLLRPDLYSRRSEGEG